MLTMPVFVWLILVPFVGAPVVYLLGRLWPRQTWARWAGLSVLALTTLAFIQTLVAFNQSGPTTFSVGMATLRFDGLSLLLTALTLGLGLCVSLFSIADVAREVGDEKYQALVLMVVGAIIGLSCANDLFNLWVWFETLALAALLLVAFYPAQPGALEAGVKYLVASVVGSALVLIGIALVLAQTGTLNLTQLRTLAPDSALLRVAGALFIVGFGVKAALVPLHTWLPDAHSQAPSGISALLSGVVIEAGLVALLRTLSLTAQWGTFLLAFGALNMLAGNLLALRQTHLKRLLAYSSLAQMGYMLVGVGLTLSSGQTQGAQGGLLHVLTHGLMKGLAFLAVGALMYAIRCPTEPDHRPLTLADLSGAARRYPLVGLALTLAVLGLGGLPPLAGFMSKWQIFVAGFETHQWPLEALVVFAALNSVLSLAYYAPVVNAVYRRQLSPAIAHGQPLPVVLQTPLVLLVLAVVLVGVWPGGLSWLTLSASQAMLGG